MISGDTAVRLSYIIFGVPHAWNVRAELIPVLLHLVKLIYPFARDFFDSSGNNQSKTASKTEAKSDPSSKLETNESLPEGFFDDPKLDAKARKVEYKDPIEEEWEKFQKVMQMENQVSEALVDVDDEESRIDRQLTELSEQRLYFLRADALRDKQTVIKDELFKRASKRRKVADEQNDSGSDSEDFEEFLDWRAKKAL